MLIVVLYHLSMIRQRKLHDAGLTLRLKANVGKLVRAQPSVLGYSLEGNLKPTVTFLGTVVGNRADWG